ncbi:phosphate acyltransferase PlsX|uniref:Phosphate acyltransferase n=1 Tax=Dendrosporobacter quercicolus TaxID=146817 RepID=A0A1G9L912_9FIRM|nr:phosphate acyltransferase PlsX [Dendrosporobacter quercicolus]NSL46631.1 phosphate acyltransferase PlsX [Dendrosporobacter quercicolus DSM 1736]SDL58045.1 phosphate:acyl-[acyl carrier protein] acyltransferase [Dendrosporobacter quercicolus]
MRIAVDAMGSDYAPEQIVLGAIEAAREYCCEILLVGDQEEIEKILHKNDIRGLNIRVQHASEVIEMHEHPGAAVRKKKDASVVVATKLVKDRECAAVISAGSTGAGVAAALFGLGRIKGIDRPTIATPIPNINGATVLLDSGANVDSKPRHLVQSAIMGSLYAEYVLGIKNPRVGLLNIGEEETKGNEQALATYPLLKQLKTIHFIGNAEGRDIPRGTVDVVVCDGFVGNVVLKFSEGLAGAMLQLLKDTIKSSGLLTKLASLMVLPALKTLKKKIDYAEYGGAPLLGVDGCFIICHGSSKAKAIKNAIRVAIEFTDNKVVEHIRENIAKEGLLTNDSE